MNRLEGRPTKKILVVDDDKDEHELLTTAFKEESPGCRITCLESGKTCLCYLQQVSEDDLPQLIVLDYNMPGWNGSEVLLQLKSIPRLKDIPVVIYSTSGNLHQPTTNGANAFIQKAASWQGIKENIRTFLLYGG